MTSQAWPRPSRPRPIVVIGAGGIVRTAHLPTYRTLDLPVAGVYDTRLDTANAVAAEFSIPRVFPTLESAAAADHAIFDIAVPGDQVLSILAGLPAGAAVLIQKPMGPDLATAAAIRECCRERGLTAAVNFQLRFSPNVLAVRDLISRNELGPIVDLDVRIVIDQPWHLWTFLKTAPRLEVPYHSIHYLDTIRWLIGEPDSVYCRVARHPSTPELADTRSSIILGYGDRIRCALTLNHTHRMGPRHRASQMIVEGMRWPGFAFVEVMSPCVTFRPEQREWKKLARPSGQPTEQDRAAATALALADDGLGMGIFFRGERVPVAQPLAPLRG